MAPCIRLKSACYARARRRIRHARRTSSSGHTSSSVETLPSRCSHEKWPTAWLTSRTHERGSSCRHAESGHAESHATVVPGLSPRRGERSQGRRRAARGERETETRRLSGCRPTERPPSCLDTSAGGPRARYRGVMCVCLRTAHECLSSHTSRQARVFEARARAWPRALARLPARRARACSPRARRPCHAPHLLSSATRAASAAAQSSTVTGALGSTRASARRSSPLFCCCCARAPAAGLGRGGGAAGLPIPPSPPPPPARCAVHRASAPVLDSLVLVFWMTDSAARAHDLIRVRPSRLSRLPDPSAKAPARAMQATPPTLSDGVTEPPLRAAGTAISVVGASGDASCLGHRTHRLPAGRTSFDFS